MLKKILVAIVAVVAAFLLIVALQPSEFRVTRSASIAAPPAALFEQVNDLHKFETWNPWQSLDPNTKNTYSGPASGVGAKCSWAGNKEVGVGSSTITESRSNELVRFRMDWKEPMEGTSTVDFTFKPDGNKTVVTWDMYGPNNFIGKAMGLFINCDKMCGDQFEKGLSNLAAVAAKPSDS